MAKSAPSLAQDEAMMRLALHVARRGLGNTAPNPAVGAVIVEPSTGEIIARGWTQPGGRPHAETEAIRRALARARGATLYVTLEPCAHFGKTPPCANAIIDAGLSRVVVGTGDPDLRTKGQGIQRLRDAGIDVTEGVLEAECRRVTLGHLLRVTRHRPFVQLKMAFAADGTVPRGSKGTPLFVTGTEARAQGHLLRAEADAILVGAGTVIDDDPELTCRLPGLQSQSPVRVVLAGARDIPREAKVFGDGAPTWVMTSTSYPDLKDVLAALADKGITRVLVEGGPTTWARFANEGLVDEVVSFMQRGDHMREEAVGRARCAVLAVAPSLAARLADAVTEHRALPTDELVTFALPPATSV